MAVFGQFDAVRGQLLRLGISSSVLAYIERLMDKKAVQRLVSHKLPFRDEIEDTQSYALLSRTRLGERSSRKYESHREYLDIHIVLEGEECIEFADTSLLTPLGSYDAKNDCLLYGNDVQGEVIHLTPGIVAVFFPQDAHMPGILSGKQCDIVKIVIKQKIK